MSTSGYEQRIYEGGTAANCRPFVLVTEGRLFIWLTRLTIE
ncbi:MAG: hypothetical protein ABF753_03780 [Lentilactobacillus hilgardii]|nr:hypothetical protein [Lentilactobacillus hilgardii]